MTGPLAVFAGFDFPFFWRVLWPPWQSPFLGAAGLVLFITLVAQTAGVILGFPLALGRVSKNALIRQPVNLYLYLFRGTPLLLQILLWFDGLAELSGNSVLLYPITRNALVAGIVLLALQQGAH